MNFLLLEILCISDPHGCVSVAGIHGITYGI